MKPPYPGNGCLKGLPSIRRPSQCQVSRFCVSTLYDKNKLIGIYVYRHRHNYIPCSTFTIAKVQLHVSAINVGHLQVVHEELIIKLYQHVWGVYSLWGGGCEISFCVGERGVDWGGFGDCVKIPFMATYSYV